jgi:transcriptional regulator with XRE-family HTH domain
MPDLFGLKLRHLRTQCGMTQAELARRLALAAHTHITHLEAGRSTPSLKLAVKSAACLEVSTDYLIRDTIPVTASDQHRVTWLAEPSESGLFGRKLRHLRQQRHLTQANLADQVGLSSAHAHISFLESNRKEPSIDLVLRIADVFGVSTDYLLRDAIPVNATGSDDATTEADEEHER